MKNYRMVSPETVKKVSECFSDTEECQEFMDEMNSVCDEIMFYEGLWKRIEDEEEAVRITLIKIFHLIIFFRENIELIKQLMKVVEYDEVME